MFPFDSWNHYNNDGPRTKIHIEGYNLKLLKYVQSHPNIWKFITKIQSEETCAALKYMRINSGTYKPRRRNKEDLERDLSISKLKCKFLSKEIDIATYLLLLSKNIHDF